MATRVLILGGGFGGLYTAIQGHRHLGGRAEITLVERNDSFLFTPLLHQVVSGRLRDTHITQPYRSLLPRSVRHHRASVKAIDVTRRVVETDQGDLTYDLLVVALGAVPNTYGIESVERYAFPFKWLNDARRLRAHILSQYARAEENSEAASDLLRVLVTGAGCTGVELVAELHDWMKGPLRKQFPGIPADAASLHLEEALDHLLCPTDPELARRAVQQLLSRDIRLDLDTRLGEVGPDWARCRHGVTEGTMTCGTVVWTAGIKPHPLSATMPVPPGPGGRIPVDESLRVTGLDGVFAIGDIAACEAPGIGFLPPTAQVAVQQASTVARNLAAWVKNRPAVAFRYRKLGEVVELGHGATLTEAFGSRFSGLPGWLLGRTIHLARLPYWGDRITVAWEWAKQTLDPV